MNITSKIQELFDHIKGLWSDNISQGVDDENLSIVRREKVIVFLISFLLALGLWFLVNMSRDYSLDVKMPITVGHVPNDKALATNLPETANVSLQGEGWKLFNIYNDPPKIALNVTRDRVNLYDQVREQLKTMPTVTVIKVMPISVEVILEDKVSKKVPVVSNASVSFRDQFSFVEPPRLEPDSVLIRGASSQLEKIDSVATEAITIKNVSSDIDRQLPLVKPNHLIEMPRSSVHYSGSVAEFTEGESSVEIKARNVPADKELTFSPPTLTVRYVVPIRQYKKANEQKPFAGYIPYNEIKQDSTGYVKPHVELTNKNLNIKIRSYQPDKVSYYHVLGSD